MKHTLCAQRIQRHTGFRLVRKPPGLAVALIALLVVSACATDMTQMPSASTSARSAPASAMMAATYLTRPPEDEVVYFMLPDRFANGDPSNDTGGIAGEVLDHGFDPTHKGFYHGGDLKGLTARLDYIRGMGATAIWLGPIYRNKAVQGPPGDESSGYHGYWITDFTDVDPHLGTRADLKAFVDAAHQRDMKVYLDIITNHTADVIKNVECHDPQKPRSQWNFACPYRATSEYPYTTRGTASGPAINSGFLGDEDHVQTTANFARLTRSDYAYTPYVPEGEEQVKTPAWLNDKQYYHNRGDSTFEGESSLYGDFAGLDDLMTEHPRVVQGFVDIFKDWISTYRVDGFRIDTTRHVNANFWRQFLPAMKAHAASEGIPHFYMFGEVYNPDPAALARFTRVDGFDQLLDFAFQSAVYDVMTERGGTARFDRFLDADALYANGQHTARRLPTFLGNHDMGRISGMIRAGLEGLSHDELLERTRVAHALMMFMRGVPVIYSGDEQGFVSDGNDQLAREDMFASQVAVYNDNNLLGTDATTADENFDSNHPLYRFIAAASGLRTAHKALRHGEMVSRLTEKDGRVFAFSRFDPDTGHEYVIAVNTGSTPRRVTIGIDYLSGNFAQLMGTCPATVNVPGNATFDLRPFAVAVCRSHTASSRHTHSRQQ